MTAAEALLLDEGVLDPVPALELGGFEAARATAGVAVLPWRRDRLTARLLGVDAHPDIDALGDTRFAQAVVHLQKGRDATWCDLTAAWERLESDGRLLFCGGNALGVVSAVKRLARELDRAPRVLANRARARVVLFERDAPGAPTPPPPMPAIPLPLAGGGVAELESAHGVFSASRLDPGTELLLLSLEAVPRPPRRLLDLGCGIGPLGLAALLRWPDARATLADADARAVACAARSARHLGVADRCTTVWWDVEEPTPAERADLVLVNPPFHAGKHVDLRPAHAMFGRAVEALAPGGRALIVANRTLPYERALADLGRLETLAETRHYKVLSLRRRSRSASSRTRDDPGSRSAGSA